MEAERRGVKKQFPLLLQWVPMSSSVTLAVYDLSQGMARQMSEQLLGMRIDMIPHTGVIVFGKEYFFGGGIQALPHQQFVASHMPPCQMINMGTTEINKELFEEFLESVRPRFTMQTYDLIRNNCNNFSDCVCNFLVGKSIPAEITGLPERVFSSPMGQMLRPMVEQMQSQIGGGASPIPGFGGGDSSVGGFPPARITPPANVSQQHNPWAASALPSASAAAGAAGAGAAAAYKHQPGAGAAAGAAGAGAESCSCNSSHKHHQQPDAIMLDARSLFAAMAIAAAYMSHHGTDADHGANTHGRHCAAGAAKRRPHCTRAGPHCNQLAPVRCRSEQPSHPHRPPRCRVLQHCR